VSTVRRGAAVVLPPLALLVAVGVAWQLAGGGSFSVAPAPSRIWQAFVDTRAVLPGHIRTTLAEAALGALVGVVAGVLIAGVVTSSVLVRRAVQPLLVASQTIPYPVLLILLAVRFGFGLTPKVMIVALVVFFPVAVSTVAGLESADRELVDLVRSFGGRRLQQLRHVLVPAAIPAALAGLRISLTYAVGAAVIAEELGATSGLGLYIARSQRSFHYDQIWVGMFIVTIVSIALYSAVYVVQLLACPWLRARSSPGSV